LPKDGNGRGLEMTEYREGDIVKVVKAGSTSNGLHARVIRETAKGGSYIVNLGTKGIRTYYASDIEKVTA
jgi:hypothetical protein